MDLEKLAVGGMIGLFVSLLAIVVVSLVTIHPVFYIVPISIVFGAVYYAKPEWITQMWKQKEYRE